MQTLDAELENALLRELLAAWRQLNANHFKDALTQPLIELFDSVTRLGAWYPEERTIRVAHKLVVEHSWGVVLEVLKHEMAHQYVHEVLRERTETAHGARFQEVCARLGIDATAAGIPAAQSATNDDPRARVLQRIAKLLALAESSNQHEAQSAMATARRLMLKYNVDVMVDAAERGARRGERYAFRQIGAITGRISEVERRVSVLLSEHFFVEAIWVQSFSLAAGRRGRVLELCGTTANLDFAHYVHDFLHPCAERLWREHQRTQGTRANRERATFLGGVIRGFSEKLTEDEKQQRREDKALVWVGDPDLQRYYRARHPYVRHTRHQARPESDAHDQGRDAGRRIILHRPIGGRASDTGIGGGPKLLRS